MAWTKVLVRNCLGRAPSSGLKSISIGLSGPPSRSLTARPESPAWSPPPGESGVFGSTTGGNLCARPGTEPGLRFGCSVRASSRSAATLPGADLARWRDAVARVPPVKVLPLGFRGEAEANTAAWYGDKCLGVAIARELRSRIDPCTPGYLTKIYGAAASNDNLAAHIELILPPSLLACIPPPQTAALQIHDFGTMVEACVDAVAVDDAEAVAELARFLVDCVTDSSGSSSEESDLFDELGTMENSPIKGSKQSFMLENNPKGKLLELGGQVEATRVGGFSHSPVFKAEARLGGRHAEAEGPSKKVAEREAAAAVLAEAGVSSLVHAAKRITLAPVEVMDAMAGDPMDAQQNALPVTAICHWKPVTRRRVDMAAILSDGEDLPAWFKRKADLHRCLLCPMIFPGVIRSLQV